MSKKRVAFEFDQRSLKTLEEMKEQGLIDTDAAIIVHHHTPLPVSEEEYRRRINRLSQDLSTARAAQAAAEEKLRAAEAQKEHAMTRLRESAAFWKQRSDHEYHKPNYPKADRYDAKREALEDVLANLESAASREDANDGR